MDTAEPKAVGNGGTDGDKPRKPDEVAGAQGCGHSLNGQNQREKEEATGDQLPGGESKQRNRPTPILGQNNTTGHGSRPGQTSDDPQEIQLSIGAQNQERHAANPEKAS